MKYDKETFFDELMPIPETGCWLYTGFWTVTGYGQYSEGPRGTNRTKRAHRTAWILFKGPIPEGMGVLHKCDIRACCNPDHLFLGTQDDNVKDMVAKGRHWSKGKVECKYGHPYTEVNTGYDKKGKRYCKECSRIKAKWHYRVNSSTYAR